MFCDIKNGIHSLEPGWTPTNSASHLCATLSQNSFILRGAVPVILFN